jgi:hypothetical protein
VNSSSVGFAQHWQTFWFRPEPPQALAVCRILLYGALFAMLFNRDFTLDSVLGQYYWDPKSFAWILYPHRPPPVGLVAWMQLIWKLSLVTSCLGLVTRVSTAIACVFGIMLLQLHANLGKIDHLMAPPCIAMIVMALSACGRIWSLDNLIAKMRGKNPAPLPVAEMGWPIQTMRVVLCLIFFCAACSKLRASGFAWVFSENMQITLIHQNAGAIARWLIRYPYLCMAMAAFGLCTEFFMPLALFSKRLARILVPAGLGMFAGIYFTMGIDFSFLMFLHFFWLPWGRIFGGTRVGVAPASPFTSPAVQPLPVT